MTALNILTNLLIEVRINIEAQYYK